MMAINVFKKINSEDKSMLLKNLEANRVCLKKNESLSTTRLNQVIGIINEGYIQIVKTDYYGNNIIIEELYKDSVFGSSISFSINEGCEILAKDDSEILLFDVAAVRNLSNDKEYHYQFLLNLSEIYMGIITQRNERIRILTNKTIRNKLLEYFDILSKKTGSRIIHLPFSYTDMADYLAVDRSAMSRELKKLKEEKIIEVKSRRITLLNR
ncbi:Crp/Fnr family transcriptional regulator [Traorella massiliensis]|uniref:Crp/Fnr family transcriptional regulator n=2 Tax=Traorella massiliensis TaxID=1903263 RepID=UPI00248DCF42|nr:Crp/Fnr family transcriptional regulator [Traorella massiliensis]